MVYLILKQNRGIIVFLPTKKLLKIHNRFFDTITASIGGKQKW